MIGKKKPRGQREQRRCPSRRCWGTDHGISSLIGRSLPTDLWSRAGRFPLL
jgi:hypothetical protein